MNPFVFYGLMGLAGVVPAFLIWGFGSGFFSGLIPEGNTSATPTPVVATVESSERLAIRQEIARVWRDTPEDRRSRGCLGYRTTELVSDDGQGDAAGLGWVITEGSLAGFDADIVEQEWRTLLEANCADLPEVELKAPKECTWRYLTETVAFEERPNADCLYNSSSGRYEIKLCLPSKYSLIDVERAGSGLSIASANPRLVTDSRWTPTSTPACADRGFRMWNFSVPRRSAELGNVRVTNNGKTVIELIPVLVH